MIGPTRCLRYRASARKFILAISWNAVMQTRKEVRLDPFDCIERFYNPELRDSPFGQISPVEFERRFAGPAKYA
jgi:hypothetical protein